MMPPHARGFAVGLAAAFVFATVLACGDPAPGSRAPSEAAVVHAPDDPAQLSRAGGRLSIRFRAEVGGVVGARLVAGRDTSPMHRQLVVGDREVWRATAHPATTRYSLEVDTPDSTRHLGPFEVPAEVFGAVPWVGGSIGYQIFPERFSNGDPSNDSLGLASDEVHFRDPSLPWGEPTLSAWNGPVGASHCCHQYFGGDLQGVIDRLDHLASLGVGVIYLNPIFLSGSAHGYDTQDYRRVAPHFGDSTVLRTLLDRAHSRGMRLIWDFVPNHVGIGHWAFQDALARGRSSDTWDWFTFRVPADSVRPGYGED